MRTTEKRAKTALTVAVLALISGCGSKETPTQNADESIVDLEFSLVEKDRTETLGDKTPTVLPDGGQIAAKDNTQEDGGSGSVSVSGVEAVEGMCAGSERGGVSFFKGREKANEIKTIGKSEKGLEILAEHWGSRQGEQIVIVTQVHGDECAGGLLAQAVRSNPPATWGLWMIATLNPDGNNLGVRRNANNVDLNRDGYSQSSSETRAFLGFVQEIRPTFIIHVHSPLNWVGPWGDKTAREMAEAISRRSGLKLNGWAGDDLGYLWEGADIVMPGANSVLVEFPAVSNQEATASLRNGRGAVASVKDVKIMADGVLEGIKEMLGS